MFTMLKRIGYYTAGVCLMWCVTVLNASAQTVTKTENGVIIHPDATVSGGVQAVQLQVISNNIIRVRASPVSGFTNDTSLITVYTKPTSGNFSVNETNDAVAVKTTALTATVNKKTGAVSFTDANGKTVLQEKQANGRSVKPVVYDGQGFYKIKQVFETTPDDAIYGLGQHQDGIMNYRNQQVFFFQNNTEVAVPFLV